MPLAGALVRASDIRNPVVYFKGALESRTSTTSLANDADITLPLDVGLWAVDFYGVCSSTVNTADIIVDWTFSGTATLRHRSGISMATSGTDVRATDGVFRAGMSLTTAPGYGTDSNAGDRSTLIKERLVLEVTVAGSAQLRWAQAVSIATAVSLTTQTYAEVQQLEEV